MSDLFPIPESPLPPLEAARRRYDQLRDEILKQKTNNRQLDSVPDYGLFRKLIEAQEEVERLEQEAMRK